MISGKKIPGLTPCATNEYGIQAVRRALPLARLALMTFLPPLVCMRALKPWVRFRRKLLGWNVLFIMPPRVYASKLINRRARIISSAVFVKYIDQLSANLATKLSSGNRKQRLLRLFMEIVTIDPEQKVFLFARIGFFIYPVIQFRIMSQLWDQCVSRLESELSESDLNTWIRPLQAFDKNKTL